MYQVGSFICPAPPEGSKNKSTARILGGHGGFKKKDAYITYCALRSWAAGRTFVFVKELL